MFLFVPPCPYLVFWREIGTGVRSLSLFRLFFGQKKKGILTRFNGLVDSEYHRDRISPLDHLCCRRWRLIYNMCVPCARVIRLLLLSVCFFFLVRSICLCVISRSTDDDALDIDDVQQQQERIQNTCSASSLLLSPEQIA